MHHPYCFQLWDRDTDPPATLLPGFELRRFDARGQDPRVRSNFLRIQVAASTSANVVYADCDVRLRPAFFQWLQAVRPAGPLFAFHKDRPDTFLFASCGQSKFFAGLLAEKAQRGIPDCVGWNRRVLRDKTVGQIAPHYYEHDFATLHRSKQ